MRQLLKTLMDSSSITTIRRVDLASNPMAWNKETCKALLDFAESATLLESINIDGLNIEQELDLRAMTLRVVITKKTDAQVHCERVLKGKTNKLFVDFSNFFN